MNTDYENKWLVKSDNKIVGPYSFDQIEDFLFKRQISLIDEVRDMNTRWLYIREVPEFKEMVSQWLGQQVYTRIPKPVSYLTPKKPSK